MKIKTTTLSPQDNQLYWFDTHLNNQQEFSWFIGQYILNHNIGRWERISPSHLVLEIYGNLIDIEWTEHEPNSEIPNLD